MPSEKSLLANLLNSLRKEIPRAVIFKHADSWTVGMPDVSISFNYKTTWIEAKLGPKFSSTGIQDLTMLRLEKEAHCAKYVVFLQEDKKQTYIVSPKNLTRWREEPDFVFEGFNNLELIKWLQTVHHESNRAERNTRTS